MSDISKLVIQMNETMLGAVKDFLGEQFNDDANMYGGDLYQIIEVTAPMEFKTTIVSEEYLADLIKNGENFEFLNM